MKKWFYPLAVVTFIGFMALFFSFTHNEMVEFDEEIGEALIGNEFIRFFHYFGEPIWIMSAAVLLIVYLAFKSRNYRGMLFVLFAVGGGNMLNLAIKEWVQRARPDIPHQLTSFSFPSNHAMVGLLYIFTYAYFLTENLASKKWRIVIWISAVLFTLLVGLSRIAGNNHYGTDVIAGWMCGYSIFIMVVVWYEWRNRHMKSRVAQPE